ncbi:MAG: hypothetical protein SGCHY_005330 [Lobulomycetales sp.]
MELFKLEDIDVDFESATQQSSKHPDALQSSTEPGDFSALFRGLDQLALRTGPQDGDTPSSPAGKCSVASSSFSVLDEFICASPEPFSTSPPSTSFWPIGEIPVCTPSLPFSDFPVCTTSVLVNGSRAAPFNGIHATSALQLPLQTPPANMLGCFALPAAPDIRNYQHPFPSLAQSIPVPSRRSSKVRECHFCGKRFNRSWSLKSHLITHTGARDFKCNLCDSTFGRKSDMQRHVRNVHKSAKKQS